MGRTIEIKGQGHMVSVKGLSKQEASNLHTALSQDGVVETLIATGQMQSLSPAQRRLAAVLVPEGDQ